MKIAIFQWGEVSINAYYLAIELINKNIEVDFYLYTHKNCYNKQHLKNLLIKTRNNINTIELKPSFFDSKVISLNHITALLGFEIPALFSNPFLPQKTREKFNESQYNFIITIGQNSLYWLSRTSKSALAKTIHYSLEVQKISDPYFITPSFKEIIKIESKLLKHLKGLIIQDVARAEALLNDKISNSKLQFFFIPISIPGAVIKTKSSYLYDKLEIKKEKKIVLYFGAVYEERYLKEIVNVFNNSSENSTVLVLHGPDDFSNHINNVDHIKTSHELVDYNDIHLIISSATIGLALYDNGWSNTRYTAFSSEKIARYLQCGVPFIAFNNESYRALKNQFGCCELITEIEELESAIEKINANYENYRDNSFKAFENYYCIEKSASPLINFITASSEVEEVPLL